MRSRSNSGVRLDYYQRMVAKTIMRHQVKCWVGARHSATNELRIMKFSSYGLPK